MQPRKYYVTTTLPYVNADPHIGFAMELIQADVLARYHRLMGAEVVFNTGTDEHGQKIYQKATEAGVEPRAYTDRFASRFEALKESLSVSYTHFIRTSNPNHYKAAQAFWQRCANNGDIYKKEYRVKYCVGCELEKTDSELEDGKCPIHPTYELEIREEENYFFRFSKYQEALLKLYDEQPDFVVPDYRLKEIRNFVAGGLQDFSISRLKEKMPWGVPVPGDDDHVMYVWFDALVNYISTLGWPNEEGTYAEFWPGVQIAGKDNLRQQSAMWQAMLMSAGLPTSRQILIHGFITSEGKKMSKSIGNVVDPFGLVEEFGTDAVRYYLLREIPFGNDGDYSTHRMEERYGADLANELGNLLQRTLTMVEKYCNGSVPDSSGDSDLVGAKDGLFNAFKETLDSADFHQSLVETFAYASALNQYIDIRAPWKEAKAGNQDHVEETLYTLLQGLYAIAIMLLPFLPETAEKMLTQLGASADIQLDPQATTFPALPSGTLIAKGESLFPRRDV